MSREPLEMVDQEQQTGKILFWKLQLRQHQEKYPASFAFVNLLQLMLRYCRDFVKLVTKKITISMLEKL